VEKVSAVILELVTDCRADFVSAGYMHSSAPRLWYRLSVEGWQLPGRWYL